MDTVQEGDEEFQGYLQPDSDLDLKEVTIPVTTSLLYFYCCNSILLTPITTNFLQAGFSLWNNLSYSGMNAPV